MSRLENSGSELLQLLRSRVRAIVGFALAGAVLGYAVSLLVPRRYTATTSFAVASQRDLGAAARLGGFAAQLGLAPTLNSEDSPDFFAQVAGSRDVRRAMARDTVCADGPCSTVAAALGDPLPSDTDRRGWEQLLKDLNRRFSVGVDPKTAIITVSAWGPSPASAEGLLRAEMRELSSSIVDHRESQARNERLFAEERLRFLNGQERAVRDSLIDFYQSNRATGSSAQLRFRENDLTRQLAFWQGLVQNIANEAEMARLSEVKDVPVITVVEQPYASPKKTFPKGSMFAIVGALLAALFAIVPALVRLFRERSADHDSDEAVAIAGATPFTPGLSDRPSRTVR